MARALVAIVSRVVTSYDCRFFRLRCERLERFEDLVTVDMYAHFKAIADNTPPPPPHKASSGRPRTSGVPLLRRSGPPGGDSRDVGAWVDRDGGRFMPGGGMHDGGGPSGGPCSDDSLFGDNRQPDGAYHQSMLEQHRGVYARLGTYSRLKGSRAEQWLRGPGDGVRSLGSEDGGGSSGKARTRPMELQVWPPRLQGRCNPHGPSVTSRCHG